MDSHVGPTTPVGGRAEGCRPPTVARTSPPPSFPPSMRQMPFLGFLKTAKPATIPRPIWATVAFPCCQQMLIPRPPHSMCHTQSDALSKFSSDSGCIFLRGTMCPIAAHYPIPPHSPTAGPLPPICDIEQCPKQKGSLWRTKTTLARYSFVIPSSAAVNQRQRN